MKKKPRLSGWADVLVLCMVSSCFLWLAQLPASILHLFIVFSLCKYGQRSEVGSGIRMKLRWLLGGGLVQWKALREEEKGEEKARKKKGPEKKAVRK